MKGAILATIFALPVLVLLALAAGCTAAAVLFATTETPVISNDTADLRAECREVEYLFGPSPSEYEQIYPRESVSAYGMCRVYEPQGFYVGCVVLQGEDGVESPYPVSAFDRSIELSQCGLAPRPENIGRLDGDHRIDAGLPGEFERRGLFYVVVYVVIACGWFYASFRAGKFILREIRTVATNL
jgi:hypothetical protein